MAWDSTKPPQGGPRLSAEIRQGWEAIERTALSANLARNTIFKRWGGGLAVPPVWAVESGAPTITKCGPSLGDTKEFGLGGYSAKVVAGGSIARLGQTIIKTLPTYYRGRSVSLGCWGRASGIGVARFYINDGVGISYGSYLPDSADQWSTFSATLSGSASALNAGVEVLAGATCYVEGLSIVHGSVPPQLYVPQPPPDEFEKGGSVFNPYGITAAANLPVWLATSDYTVVGVRGYRVGGTGATVNARKNGASNHLASALSLSSADTWIGDPNVQNVEYAAGDRMEIMIVSVTGSPTQVVVVVDVLQRN